jgi:uncharacterized membrane protein
MWGYLDEFWGSITDVGSTTIAWFQNVGNAVAGAIGNLFESTLHYINDTWVFLGWIFSVIGQLVSLFLLPLNFIFQFLKGFLSSAFATPTDYSFTWSSEILAVFNHIPLWSTMSLVLGVCLSILALVAILWLFTKL